MHTAIQILLAVLLVVLLGFVVYFILVMKDLRRTLRESEEILREIKEELPPLLENIQVSASKTRWILDRVEKNLISATGTVGMLTKALRPTRAGFGQNVLYTTLLGLGIGLIEGLLKRKKRGGEPNVRGKEQ